MPSRKGEKNIQYKHGGAKTKLYVVWCSMKARCNRPTWQGYERYGGRGIKVCDEWSDFAMFRDWAMANGYAEGLTIERKDNDGDYCPQNCTWATKKQQSNNQSTTIKIKYMDIEKTLHEWADFLGIKPCTIYYRFTHGWPIERVLFEKGHAEINRALKEGADQ